MRILNFHRPANNLSRGRRLHMLFFLGVPENFAKLTGKHLCRSLGAGAYSLRVFFREFSETFKSNFSQRDLRAGAACYLFCL